MQPYALFTLFERPALVLSPPQPFKSEDRKVLIGAREPMTKEHMVMELVEEAHALGVCVLRSSAGRGGVYGAEV